MKTVTSQPTIEEYRQRRFKDLSPAEVKEAVELNKGIFDDHHDLNFIKQLNEEVLVMLSHYYRPQFIGFEEMPAREKGDKPLIYACNHSGMSFPWDAMILGAGLFR